MNDANGSATTVAQSVAIQLQIWKSLMPGRMKATCFISRNGFSLEKVVASVLELHHDCRGDIPTSQDRRLSTGGLNSGRAGVGHCRR